MLFSFQLLSFFLILFLQTSLFLDIICHVKVCFFVCYPKLRPEHVCRMHIRNCAFAVPKSRKETVHKHKLVGRPAGISVPTFVSMKLWRFPWCFCYMFLRWKTKKTEKTCQKKVQEQNRKNVLICCMWFDLLLLRGLSVYTLLDE